MRIAFDTAGFENGLDEAVRAAVSFSRGNPGVQLVLVGDREAIRRILPKASTMEIVHATQTVVMEDDISVIRTKPDSSMMVAIGLVADGKADGVVSAGSTAPFVAGCTVIIGKLPGVRKAAFMPWLPSSAAGGTYLLDVGANKECTGEDLAQFAVMGSVFAKKVKNLSSPVVKILNIGTEENKGLQMHADANRLLKDSQTVRYEGFIESRELLGGGADVVVCDGYSGNLALKAMEGSLRKVLSELKKGYKKPWGWPGFFFSIPVLLGLSKKFDYRENAGALVVGLQQVAVKTHGSADYRQFLSSLRLCKECVEAKVVAEIAGKFVQHA